MTFALEVLPFALFSLVGGSLAGRLDRRKLMLGADALRFAIIAAFTVALWRNALSLPLLYGGVVLLSLCAAVYLGAQASSIPFLLGKDRAKAAVAALVATEQGVNLVAPPVGGAIFGLVGALPALAMNAATYLTSQLSIASVTLCAACGAFEITTIVGWRMRIIPEAKVGRVFGVIRLLAA